MFKLNIMLCLLAWACLLPAQKHDYYWLTGYGGGNQSPYNDEFGMTTIDFTPLNKPLVTERQDLDMNLNVANASLCDSSGHLLFYTNGEKIYGPNHKLMSNGNDIGDKDGYGYRAPQGALALPRPGKPHHYYLFNIEQEQTSFLYARKLYVNKIDMTLNGGKGHVTEKKVLLMEDTMSWGRICAVKHANGRDWWALIQRNKSNQYFRWLITPNGISKADTILGGDNIRDGLGQSVFSPDGSKFIRINSYNAMTLPRLDIFDFDRCSGTLSNQRTKLIDHIGFGAGVAVSPDSRYLYVMRTVIVYQYDLTAADIFSTETVVAEYDNFLSHGSATIFYLGQLAPDGRIYVGGLNATFHMHYINFPNRTGSDCEFVQHGLKFEVLYLSAIPNNPNYRLGPLDGSPCDTLGLDNHPLSNWRWEQVDTLAPLQVTFTDLSSYEPATWHWDFGDGTMSADTSPVHEYAKKGVYEVCLIVSNQYSADTFCQVLYLGVSGVEAPELAQSIQVSPNPFRERLSVSLSSPQRRAVLYLYDLTGRLVRRAPLTYGISEIETEDLAAGMYFWEVESGGIRVKSGKTVKIE